MSSLNAGEELEPSKSNYLLQNSDTEQADLDARDWCTISCTFAHVSQCAETGVKALLNEALENDIAKDKLSEELLELSFPSTAGVLAQLKFKTPGYASMVKDEITRSQIKVKDADRIIVRFVELSKVDCTQAESPQQLAQGGSVTQLDTDLRTEGATEGATAGTTTEVTAEAAAVVEGSTHEESERTDQTDAVLPKQSLKAQQEEGEVVVEGKSPKPALEHSGTAVDTATAAAATAAGATSGATTAAAAGTRPAVWAPPTRKDIRAVGPRAIPTAEQLTELLSITIVQKPDVKRLLSMICDVEQFTKKLKTVPEAGEEKVLTALQGLETTLTKWDVIGKQLYMLSAAAEVAFASREDVDSLLEKIKDMTACVEGVEMGDPLEKEALMSKVQELMKYAMMKWQATLGTAYVHAHNYAVDAYFAEQERDQAKAELAMSYKQNEELKRQNAVLNKRLNDTDRALQYEAGYYMKRGEASQVRLVGRIGRIIEGEYPQNGEVFTAKGYKDYFYDKYDQAHGVDGSGGSGSAVTTDSYSYYSVVKSKQLAAERASYNEKRAARTAAAHSTAAQPFDDELDLDPAQLAVVDEQWLQWKQGELLKVHANTVQQQQVQQQVQPQPLYTVPTQQGYNQYPGQADYHSTGSSAYAAAPPAEAYTGVPETDAVCGKRKNEFADRV